jgi:hypothetical protein
VRRLNSECSPKRNTQSSSITKRLELGTNFLLMSDWPTWGRASAPWEQVETPEKTLHSS